jgi:hypothetical protein
VLPVIFQAGDDDQPATPPLEASILEYQKMLRELEGRSSFEHDLAAYP